jgi:hypothetical protein
MLLRVQSPNLKPLSQTPPSKVYSPTSNVPDLPDDVVRRVSGVSKKFCRVIRLQTEDRRPKTEDRKATVMRDYTKIRVIRCLSPFPLAAFHHESTVCIQLAAATG